MTDVTNFVEGDMERFLDYQKECNKLLDLTEKRDIRDQIKVLVDKMDDKELVPLKTSLMKSLLDEKIDELKNTSWYEGNAADLVKQLILNDKSDVTAKMAFIAMLKNEKYKFDKSAFTQKGAGDLDDLVDTRIKSGEFDYPTFRDKVLKFNEQAASGVGKGELFLLIFGKNSQKPSSRGGGAKGDVIIDGHHIEVKDSGGMFHAGKEEGLAKASEVFAFNEKMIQWAKKNGYSTNTSDGVQADAKYFRFSPVGRKQTRGGDWFHEYLTGKTEGKKLPKQQAETFLAKYLAKVYIQLDMNEAKRMAAKLFPALGDVKLIEKVSKEVFTPFVFNSYRDVEQFDSLIVLKGSKYANIIDGYDMPPSVRTGTPTISKGKSTYAVPAGAIGIALK